MEAHVIHAQSHNFLYSCAGIEHRCEECVVTTTISGGSVNRGEHRLDLSEFEVLDGTGARTLERNRQDALTQLQMVRMLRGAVPKEGMNRGEAHVSGRGDIVSRRFKVVKEIQHRLG